MRPPFIELRARLYPDNPLRTPQPGFPDHAELVEWAKTQDVDEIRDEALTILGEPGFAAQYAAMGLLRELGVSVDGEGHGDQFRWVVEYDGHREVIVPMSEDYPGPSPDDV